MKKRRSNAGETLVETLAAVLIVGISTTLFLTFVMTSSNMNQAAKEKDDAVYAQLSAAETASGEAKPQTIQFGADSVDVKVYGDENGLLSYRIQSGAAEGGAP